MSSNCSSACTQDWTASPSSRGTLDIIWASLTVLLLCSWSCICCNVPAPGETAIRYFVRKLWLTVICITGPEFLLYISMTQWLSARKSVGDFHEAGHHQWTMEHAFLADMGGFRIKTSDAESFPISSRSLLYLIQQDFIAEKQVRDLIMIDTDTIRDRNKTDPCARLLALIQTCWFVCNTLARYAQGLTVSTLELTVLGFLAPTLVTYVCWWHKPRDVMTAQLISIDASIEVIYHRAGLPISTEWHCSPLDFVERSEFHGSLLFRYWINILKRIVRPRQVGASNYVDVIQRRSDNHIYPLESHWKYGWIEAIPTMPYLAINFAAWDSHFPTQAEVWLWRISSVVMAGTYITGLIIETMLLQFWPADAERQGLKVHRDEARSLSVPNRTHLSVWRRSKLRLNHLCQKLRNNSITDDPSLDVPLRILIAATVCAAMYCLGRLCILVEDLASFREMPRSTFETVDWTSVIPHIA